MTLAKGRLTNRLFGSMVGFIVLFASAALHAAPGIGDKEGTDVAEPRYLRTAFFEALALAVGTAWYWIDRERQVADWDFPSWTERLTLDVLRYDNNPFSINFAWHGFNGASYHALARANRLGVWESAGAGLLTSMAWEYALEFREKVSINDLVFTTGVGISLGEFFHVFGRYLSNDPAARRLGFLRWTAGLPMAVTGRLDGRGLPEGDYFPHAWHQMRLGYSVSIFEPVRAKQAGADTHLWHTIMFDGRFVRLREYRRLGSWSTFFHSAEFTSAMVEFSRAASGSGTRILADTILLGYYRQRMNAGGVSTGTMLGVSMAYRYRREQFDGWDDRVGVLHFPGPAVDWYINRSGFSAEAQVRVHYDFAGINALANRDWNLAYPNEQGKTILRKQGYNYSYGPSASLMMTVRIPPIELGASVWVAHYESDEGLDRIQEDLTVDQQGIDRVLDTRIGIRVNRVYGPVYGAIEVADRWRDSRLDELRTTASVRRFTMQLGLSW